MVVDRPGVIADVTAILRDMGVSLESMLQRGRSPGEAVPVVLVTHETRESAMREALDRIGALPTVMEEPTLIRIEAGVGTGLPGGEPGAAIDRRDVDTEVECFAVRACRPSIYQGPLRPVAVGITAQQFSADRGAADDQDFVDRRDGRVGPDVGPGLRLVAGREDFDHQHRVGDRHTLRPDTACRSPRYRGCESCSGTGRVEMTPGLVNTSSTDCRGR